MKKDRIADVYVAEFRREDGTDIRVFDSAELALAWRAMLAAENWFDLFGEDSPNPITSNDSSHFWWVAPDRFGWDFEDDPERVLAGLSKHAIWLPVWMYDHSGVTYSASKSNPFSCPWDSGMVGLIYVSKEDVRKEYGVKRIDSKLRRRVETILENEVAVYSDWACGNVFGWIVTDPEGDTVDSCWGYIGEQDYCLTEGISMAEYFVERWIEDAAENRRKLVAEVAHYGRALAEASRRMISVAENDVKRAEKRLAEFDRNTRLCREYLAQKEVAA